MRIFLACLIGAIAATTIFPNNYVLGLLLGGFVALISFGVMRAAQIVIMNIIVNRLHYKKKMLEFTLEAERTLQDLIELKKVSAELDRA